MRRRHLTAALLAGAWQSAWPGWVMAAANEGEAATGVRAALERGALAAVSLLGRSDGFLGDPRVRIPLPKPMADIAKFLKAAGQGKKVEELETAMNRAAEAAVPEAKALFVSTVKAMSVQDALKLVQGGPTSATDYFASKTRAPLGEKFLPIVTKATEKVALAERYNTLAAKASSLGLLKGEQVDVQHHVTARALDGLFLVMAEEEKKIRADPLKTGSAILKKVFGG